MTIIMQDQADKTWLSEPEPMENKLGNAIAYLSERGIWRGRADCVHRYTNSEGKRIVPSLSAYTSNGRVMP